MATKINLVVAKECQIQQQLLTPGTKVGELVDGVIVATLAGVDRGRISARMPRGLIVTEDQFKVAQKQAPAEKPAEKPAESGSGSKEPKSPAAKAKGK